MSIVCFDNSAATASALTADAAKSAAAAAARGPRPRTAIATGAAADRDRESVAAAAGGASAVDPSALALRLAVAFRRHPHVGNVVTHICGGQWERVEQALRRIFDPTSDPDDLSSLAHNLVELMWTERGVTGRILKPYVRELFAGILPHLSGERLLNRLADLSQAHPNAVAGARVQVEVGARTVDRGIGR